MASGAIRPHPYVFDRRVMTMLSGQDYAFGDNGGSQMSAQREVISGTNGQHMCRMIERYYHVTDGTAIRYECM